MHHAREKHSSHPGRVSGPGKFRQTWRGDNDDVDRDDRIVDGAEICQATEPDLVEPVCPQLGLGRDQADHVAKSSSLVNTFGHSFVDPY